MMLPWGTGWSSWITLCARYAADGCPAVVEWIDTHLTAGDSIDGVCPNGTLGTIMGWTIECNGSPVPGGQSGVQTAPYSFVRNLPGPVAGHPTLTIWVACGGP